MALFRTRVGGKTELALMEHRHARELFELIDANRAHLRAWMNWVDQRRTAADVANYIAAGMKQFVLNQGIQVGIWEGDRLCGMIVCAPLDWPQKAACLEYWLGAAYQGKGIMASSCRAMIEHLLGTLGLHRLTVRCAVENSRSRALAERLGFTFEGIARDAEWLYDHYVDHAVYGLLKGDAG